MSTEPSEPTVDELLQRGRPLPPYGEMVIDDLTEEEAEAFLDAVNADQPAVPDTGFDYEIWVDDHMIDDDGNIIALVKHARPGVDPQVGNVFMVGDGEQKPFPARVIERTRHGLVILAADPER